MRRFTNKILVLCNIALALALLFAYFSNFINPAKAWFFAFFGLAYPVLLLLNIAFLLFWVWRRKKIALLSLFIIIIGFSHIGRYFQIYSSANGDFKPNSFKLLSYNVRVFNHFEWEKKISVRDSILEYINSESPSIVCLQEFLTRSTKWEQSEGYILKKLKSVRYQHIEYTYDINGSSSRFGIATYSYYPIIHRGNIKFKNSINACIYTDIALKTDTIRVYNVHLQSIRLNKYNYDLLDSIFSFNSRRIDEMKDISGRLKTAFMHRGEQVDAIANHMKLSPYPVILCGDFNDTPVSYTYQKLLGQKKDSFRESGGGLGNTYRGKLPSYRIDYIFHSEKYTSTFYKTCAVNFSDHFPVYSLMQIKTSN